MFVSCRVVSELARSTVTVSIHLIQTMLIDLSVNGVDRAFFPLASPKLGELGSRIGTVTVTVTNKSRRRGSKWETALQGGGHSARGPCDSAMVARIASCTNQLAVQPRLLIGMRLGERYCRSGRDLSAVPIKECMYYIPCLQCRGN